MYQMPSIYPKYRSNNHLDLNQFINNNNGKHYYEHILVGILSFTSEYAFIDHIPYITTH